MSIISEWVDTGRNIITGPAEFFRAERRREGFGFPIKFALLSLIAAAVINAAGAFLFTGGVFTERIPAALSILIGTPILGLIGLFIGAGLIHIFVYLLGGEHGYRTTFAVLAYATVLSPIAAVFSLIPFIGGLIGLLIALYGVYIEIKGLEIFQNMSTGRAAAAILLPAVIIFVIVFVLSIIFFSLFAISNFVTGPA